TVTVQSPCAPAASSTGRPTRAVPPGSTVPRQGRSCHCGAWTPREVPTRKTGSRTGEVPTLPTVNARVRAGGEPNRVSRPESPSSRVPVRTDSRPPVRSAGSGSTVCPATLSAASASAFAPRSPSRRAPRTGRAPAVPPPAGCAGTGRTRRWSPRGRRRRRRSRCRPGRPTTAGSARRSAGSAGRGAASRRRVRRPCRPCPPRPGIAGRRAGRPPRRAAGPRAAAPRPPCSAPSPSPSPPPPPPGPCRVRRARSGVRPGRPVPAGQPQGTARADQQHRAAEGAEGECRVGRAGPRERAAVVAGAARTVLSAAVLSATASTARRDVEDEGRAGVVRRGAGGGHAEGLDGEHAGRADDLAALGRGVRAAQVADLYGGVGGDRGVVGGSGDLQGAAVGTAQFDGGTRAHRPLAQFDGAGGDVLLPGHGDAVTAAAPHPLDVDG